MEKDRPFCTDSRLELLLELGDSDYRHAFVEGHATDTIALQLRELRKAREWDQRDVARELGNPKLQPMISRYENPNYGKYSIATLLELARVFDVALIVRFAPFSELVQWDWAETASSLNPPRFSKDKELNRLEQEIISRSYICNIHDMPSNAGPSLSNMPGKMNPQPLTRLLTGTLGK